MEVSKCRLCFRHSWVQKFKCDCDSAFVCLSVCLFLTPPLTLFTSLWGFILRQNFNGNKGGISNPMLDHYHFNSPGGKKASHF